MALVQQSPSGEGSRQAANSRLSRQLERKVAAFCHRHALFRPGEGVLVGASGGPDSLALLFILYHLRHALGIKLAIAHFDHQLRRGSAGDARFVAEVARGLNVPVSLGCGDVRAHARAARLGLEAAARELRYRFLAEAAAAVGAGVVAVGHTADDRVETLLLHLLRGSGLAGLAGLMPSSPWPFPEGGPRLARPLLELRRTDTAAYCRQEGLRPRLDPSNQSRRFLRNRLRWELLPELRRYNRRVDGALLRLAAAAAEAEAALASEAEEAFERLARVQGGDVALPIAPVQASPGAVRTRVLRTAYRRAAGWDRELGERHLAAMARVLQGGAARASLPGGYTLRRAGAEVILARGLPAASPVPETVLQCPGVTQVAGWRVEAELLPQEGAPLPSGPWEAHLDADEVGPRLWVRSRQPGDRFRPLGLGGTRKLQDFFVDVKVPREEREAVPLVCDEGGILWVVGHRMDERGRVTASTRRVLRLRLHRTS